MIDAAQHVDRNLIYTAISRAKKMCFVIGSLRELNAGIREVKSRDRKTFVAEYLKELCT
jgi:ATP-dependent exoDNAse (exonuclease V) alpha subunit